MDVISHGLWPWFIFNRKKNWRWWAAGWGMFPDLGTLPQIYYLLKFFGIKNLFSIENWDTLFIPEGWMFTYFLTHSLITPWVIAGLYWLVKKRLPWPLLVGWSLHILLDMFTHAGVYANRPLFPFSDFSINGVMWSNPWIFWSNWLLLVVAFGWLAWRRWQKLNISRQTRKT
ncbi:hypothetical protein C4546_00100 [Candidatus Parcubacteria bacterium]|jgi:hypothetical protein|nr:MAG: hypothetical protein C4546_00100 [Candidatus Parcubacteria bacterium]